MFVSSHTGLIPSKRTCHRIRRRALASFLSGTMALATWFGGLTTSMAADDLASQASNVGTGGVAILVHRFDPTASIEAAIDNALRQATQSVKTPPVLQSAGTHDSMPSPKPIELETLPEVPSIENVDEPAATLAAETASPDAQSQVNTTRALRRTSSEFDRIVAAAITTSAAQLGIPLMPNLQTWGPTLDLNRVVQATAPSIGKLASNQDSGTKTPVDPIDTESESLNAEPASRTMIDPPGIDIADLNRKWLVDSLAHLASEEPVDIHPSSDQIDTTPPQSVVAEVKHDPLMGSSPMIVTIEEEYRPYDFAARDLKWLSNPLSTVVPFKPEVYCFATADSQADTTPTSDPVEEAISESQSQSIAESNTASIPPNEQIDLGDDLGTEWDHQVAASPYCLLDEAIWTASIYAERVGLATWTLESLAKSAGDAIARLYPLISTTTASAVVPNQVNSEAIVADTHPLPVPDPLPNASPEEVRLALAKLDQIDAPEQEADEVVLLPAPDPIPNIDA
ncbi:MAG: hypothetical protein AAF745_17705, partial [Planctomycetota bacterium]